MPYITLLITSILALSACVTIPTPQHRLNLADQLAAQYDWQPQLISTAHFDLMTYAPGPTKTNVLTVYIEGDGFSWRSRTSPSSDPTPITPTGLKLALKHPSNKVAYLARPCQFTLASSARGCEKTYWTDSRFSQHIVEASNEALNQLKADFSATTLHLIGYSGGASIAAILAATRDDITELTTVAGNLDHQAWTQYHNISPLSHSLNPIDYLQQLAMIPQTHFSGQQDKLIPLFLLQDFVNKFPVESKVKIISVDQQSHGCCWERHWPQLLNNRN